MKSGKEADQLKKRAPLVEDMNYVNVENTNNNSTMLLCRDLPSVIGHSNSLQESTLNFKDSYCYISLGTEPGPEHPRIPLSNNAQVASSGS